jgi:hypothetical protein
VVLAARQSKSGSSMIAIRSGQVFDHSAEGLPTLPLISGKWIGRAVNEFT